VSLYNERTHTAEMANVDVTADARTIFALHGLVEFFTGDDALFGLAQQAALDCVPEGALNDTELAAEIMADWDYSTTPAAAVSWLVGAVQDELKRRPRDDAKRAVLRFIAALGMGEAQ
jgi:hypothetical protein